MGTLALLGLFNQQRCLSAFNTLELGKPEDDLLSHSVHQRGQGSRKGDKAAQLNET